MDLQNRIMLKTKPTLLQSKFTCIKDMCCGTNLFVVEFAGSLDGYILSV